MGGLALAHATRCADNAWCKRMAKEMQEGVGRLVGGGFGGTSLEHLLWGNVEIQWDSRSFLPTRCPKVEEYGSQPLAISESSQWCRIKNQLDPGFSSSESTSIWWTKAGVDSHP